MSTTGELSPSDRNIVDSLRSKESVYQSGAHVYDSLGNRTMTVITGPKWSGKAPVTNEIVRLDSDFETINTTSTHPDSANHLDYKEFSDAEINGNLVDFNVTGDHVTGTFQSGFPGRHNVGPILARSILRIVDSGFQEVNVILLLVEEQEYERRIRSLDMSPTDFMPQMLEVGEARDIVEKHSNERWLNFIETTAALDSTTKAARKVIDIVRHNSGEFMTTPHALKMLEGMHNALQRVARDVH